MDNNNFVFVGYDSLGWFYEYKYQGKGGSVRKLDLMFSLQRAGTSHSIKIDCNRNHFGIFTLDGKDLFGPLLLSNDVNNLLTGKGSRLNSVLMEIKIGRHSLN
ncbi:hypothetical protein ACT7DA_16725 [Bacillus pacificus]